MLRKAPALLHEPGSKRIFRLKVNALPCARRNSTARGALLFIVRVARSACLPARRDITNPARCGHSSDARAFAASNSPRMVESLVDWVRLFTLFPKSAAARA
eukprot:scaffold133204_cov90-Phaeocystis_antarctica.AAC.1